MSDYTYFKTYVVVRSNLKTATPVPKLFLSFVSSHTHLNYRILIGGRSDEMCDNFMVVSDGFTK